ncbi:MAG: PfkB family carbohydrate kinase, partial [Thermomicrobiales bacterium]
MNAATPRARGQFLSLGELLVDMIVTDGAFRLAEAETFVARPGGAPANAAVALARLGMPAAFMGKVGDDQFGDKLQEALEARGVDISRLVRTTEAATTIAFAWKDAGGDGNFWLLRAADTLLTPADVESAGIPDLAALLMCSISLSTGTSRAATWRAAEIAASAGVPVVFDVNLRPTLWREMSEFAPACQPVFDRATIVKLSLDDAAGLFQEDLGHSEAVRRTADLAPRASVVLTDGGRGAWFVPAGSAEVVHVPPFAVNAIEPTGAGDAFTAALVRRLSAQNWRAPIVDDVRYAAAAGALA